MKFRMEVICVNEGGAEERREVMEMERQQLAMETLGLSLAEGKAILQGVQDFVASQQISEDLQRRRSCPNCSRRVSEQSSWDEHRRDRFRASRGTQSALGALPVPDRRPEDLPAHSEMAESADQSGAALLGDEVGLVDSLREGGGFIERSVAGQRVH